MHSLARIKRLRATLRDAVRITTLLEREAMNLGLYGKAAGFADIRQKCQDATEENNHLW